MGTTKSTLQPEHRQELREKRLLLRIAGLEHRAAGLELANAELRAGQAHGLRDGDSYHLGTGVITRKGEGGDSGPPPDSEITA